MKTEQIKAMVAELAPVIREFVAKEAAPLVRRIAELEARQPERGERGANGRDGVDGAPGRDGIDGRDGADGRDGVDGKDGLPGERGADGASATDEQIAVAVARFLEANPPAAGKDGRDGVDGAAGRDGVDGRDGKDGADGVAGRDGANGVDGAPGEKGADGADGVGLAGAVIDRSGDLVVTLTNGEHKNLGPVLGKDGANGRDGADGAPGAKGADGRDGIDGLGFDDLDLIEDERGLHLRFIRGTVIKEFVLPVVIDRGVWREGPYVKGSGTSWAGSFWIAQRDTSAKPDTPDSGWRLAVKRGRDGKDGKAA